MSFLEKFLISLLGLGLLSFALIWFLTKSVSLDTLRTLINNELHQLNGIHSNIKGNVSWHILPRPGLKVTDVSLTNEVGYATYSLAIEDVFLNLQLSALLRGKLVFSELNAEDFNLIINLNNSLQPKPIASHTTEQEKKVRHNKKIPGFAIESILFTHGQVTIIQGSNQIVLSGIQVGATQLNLNNQFFPIIIKGNVIAHTSGNSFSSGFYFKGRTHLKEILINPLTFLADRGLEGQLSAKNIRLNSITLEALNTTVIATPDELILNPLNLSLYEGESVGDLSFNFPVKKLSLNQTATGIHASHFTHDLLGIKLLKGFLDFSIHTSVKFQDDNWKDDIEGNGSVTIKDGILYGINLTQLAQDITQRVHALFVNDEIDLKLALKPDSLKSFSYEHGKSNFNLLNIQYRLHNSRYLDDTILLQTDKIQLRGNGHINLNDLLVDNEISAKVMTEDKLLEKLQVFLNGSLPLRLTGKLTNPILLADANKIHPLLSKIIVEKSLQKPLTEIKNTIKSFLNDIS